MVSCIRNCQTVFQGILPLCIPSSGELVFLLLHILVSVVGFGHFNRYVTGSHCLFSVYFFP